jgi:predicted helicase
VPRQIQNLEVYQSWPKITDIFQEYHTGIIAGRDNLAIHFSEDELWTTVLRFSRMDPELARQTYRLGKDARDWKVALAQKDLQRSGPSRDFIKPILYRPFDVRYTYYTGQNRGFLRWAYPDFMRHMLAGENLGLIFQRGCSSSYTMNLPQVSKHIIDQGASYPANRALSYLAPLYLYPSAELPDASHQKRRPNLAEWLLPKLSTAYGFTPTPQEVLAYLYAVLYSPTYRRAYAEALRSDFPRIPFVRDGEVFRQMAELGQRLIDLHLLRSKDLDPPRVRSYQIGGYQVLEKYLKDRRGRRLEDPVHYLRVATAISLTLEVQAEIEGVYAAVAKGPWVEGLVQGVV